MNFKKGSKVIYPRHGAGKICAVYKEIINGEEKEYYKIQFIKSNTTVAVPAQTAQELGMREPLNSKELAKVLKELNKQVKIDRKTLMTLDAISKTNLSTGKIEDMIYLVNLLKSLAKQKEEENKNFSYSYSDRLEIAEDFILSEVEIVLGKNEVKKYEKYFE